jgi:hypothetical protein
MTRRKSILGKRITCAKTPGFDRGSQIERTESRAV